MPKKKKVMFISSTGGHLSELLRLSPMFDKYNYFIITEKTKSNLGLKELYPKRVGYLVYGTKRKKLTYPFKLLYNSFKSLFYFIKFRPKVVITTGTHTAGPMCVLGKLFGSKIIYIETFANRHTKTATGKLIYKFADLFIVQWKEMLEIYPKAKLGGSIY
jgi:UDP-N-acetylglucosamine:LPS N-acetylglucosamine transferase